MKRLLKECRLALALVAALTACTRLQAATPPGFIKLPEAGGAYAYRAVSADGVVLGVRVIENDVEGERTFWTEAIKNQLRLRQGYALLDERSIENAQGLAGTELRFGLDQGQHPFRYVISLFVTPARLFLLEAGGPEKLMLENGPKLTAWATNTRLD